MIKQNTEQYYHVVGTLVPNAIIGDWKIKTMRELPSSTSTWQKSSTFLAPVISVLLFSYKIMYLHTTPAV